MPRRPSVEQSSSLSQFFRCGFVEFQNFLPCYSAITQAGIKDAEDRDRLEISKVLNNDLGSSVLRDGIHYFWIALKEEVMLPECFHGFWFYYKIPVSESERAVLHSSYVLIIDDENRVFALSLKTKRFNLLTPSDDITKNIREHCDEMRDPQKNASGFRAYIPCIETANVGEEYCYSFRDSESVGHMVLINDERCPKIRAVCVLVELQQVVTSH